MQQLIASAQVDSPVDIGALLRGSYDDELDLDASMDAGSELLTPSSLGEESEGSADSADVRSFARHEPSGELAGKRLAGRSNRAIDDQDERATSRLRGKRARRSFEFALVSRGSDRSR